jgi:hypothetical protein
MKSVDAPSNLITVVRIDGSEQTYDPPRQQGVSIYREQEKAFSVGDRIQFTAPANDLKIANRELGTVQSITDDGRMSIQLDSGRSVSIDPREHPHLDHGYAATSHSSQGQTADRVLINIDTEMGTKDLISNRMAYVSVSRGAQDAQIFTSDREKLPEALSRDVSHQSAHASEIAKVAKQEPRQAVEPAEKHSNTTGTGNHSTRPSRRRRHSNLPGSERRAQSRATRTPRQGGTSNIDGADGQFYDRHREPISAKEGLDSAMPEGQVHSHSQDLPELSIEEPGFGLSI